MVRVAAPADFFDFFHADWLEEFFATYPRVRFEFVLSDASTDLIAERIDVALRGGPQRDSGYVGRHLYPANSNGLVASSGYLAGKRAPGNLSDLQHHSCVGSAHADGYVHWRLIGPDRAEEDVRMEARFSANTAQALRKAAVAGLGIAMLPGSLARIELNAGRVVRPLPQYTCEGHGLNILYPSRRHLPLAVSAFISLVTEKLSDLESASLSED